MVSHAHTRHIHIAAGDRDCICFRIVVPLGKGKTSGVPFTQYTAVSVPVLLS